MKLLLTGVPVSAAEARRIGLVDRVVGVSELMNEARTLADQLARNAPIAMRYILDAVNRGLEMPFAQAAGRSDAVSASSRPPTTCGRARAPSSTSASRISKGR